MRIWGRITVEGQINSRKSLRMCWGGVVLNTKHLVI